MPLSVPLTAHPKEQVTNVNSISGDISLSLSPIQAALQGTQISKKTTFFGQLATLHTFDERIFVLSVFGTP